MEKLGAEKLCVGVFIYCEYEVIKNSTVFLKLQEQKYAGYNA